MTSNNLSDKNVVIIGSTAGIGLAAVKAAAEPGANVWAAGCSAAHIEKAKELSNGSFEVRQADTRDAESLQGCGWW